MGPNVDYQLLFNLAFGAATFLGGWILNGLKGTLNRLDDDMRKLPVNYVAKDDYHRDIHEMKEMLGKIFDKLDAKADKGV